MRVLCAREPKNGEEAIKMSEENINSSATTEEYPKLNKKDLALSLGAILLCSCVLSGAIPSAFIGLATAALFVYVVIAIRNIGAVIQILLTGILATVLTFLPGIGAATLALILGAGTLAWLFMILPKYKWAPILLLAVAYGLGFLVTSNPITALLALAFLPAAALMAWAHARDIGRTLTVLHAVLGFLLVVLTALCIILWRTYGSINYDSLMRLIDGLKDLFVAAGIEVGNKVLENFDRLIAPSGVSADAVAQMRGGYIALFAESNLHTIADSLMGAAPALIIAPIMVISYLADVVLLRKYYNTEWRSKMTPAACSLTISPAAGVVYFVCFLILMFANKTSLFTMAITNMCLILMPGLCLTGVNVIWGNVRRATGWMKMASILFLVCAVCCMGITSVYVLALWGAYATISAALHQRIIQKMKDENEK